MEVTDTNPLADRIWLIEQYLTGQLPEALHERVAARCRQDPAFEQEVVALWLVHNFLADEQDALAFNQTTAALSAELKPGPMDRKEGAVRYVTQKPTPFSVDIIFGKKYAPLVRPLLFAAAYVLLVGGFWSLSLPPRPVPATLPLSSDASDSMGMGGAPLQVVQYSHAPGLLGALRTADRYRWPNDTLFLYGKTVGTGSTARWRLERIPNTSQYRLKTGQHTYTLVAGQPTLTDLADERR
ncbi:hypothetical protein [Fibrella arboris]|uniref:hypothetical protein n=1 Tax=Fibrella arboris TaxID=3242486 RepID=UPI003520B9FE